MNDGLLGMEKTISLGLTNTIVDSDENAIASESDNRGANK
jgi:hypothetical protein